MKPSHKFSLKSINFNTRQCSSNKLYHHLVKCNKANWEEKHQKKRRTGDVNELYCKYTQKKMRFIGRLEYLLTKNRPNFSFGGKKETKTHET